MERRVIIVGVGGIGSWLAEGIVKMLEFKDPGSMLILVDGDEFEPKNQERQSFSGLGNKADVKANELQPYYPRTFIAPKAQWIVEAFDDPDLHETEKAVTAVSLLREGDVVFAVVDNFAARKILFDAGKEFDNIDIITGGNNDQLEATVYHYQRREGVDITDHPGEFYDDFVNPPDRNPATLSCQEMAQLEGGTQLIATNVAVASMLMGRFQHIIIDGNDPCPASEIFFDLGIGMATPKNRTAEPALVPSN